jgi:hypothetical protein
MRTRSRTSRLGTRQSPSRHLVCGTCTSGDLGDKCRHYQQRRVDQGFVQAGCSPSMLTHKDSTSMQRSCASHTMSVLSKCGSSNNTCCGSATSTICCNIHVPPFWEVASVAANPVATGTEATPVQEMSPLTRARTSRFHTNTPCSAS